MDIAHFISILDELGADFYTGVPDSLLRPFIDFVMDKYGISDKHVVAANEGAAVGLAAGHYLATSNPAVVYMQNSGIGNAVNPICSLLHRDVYAVPVIFVIGWRGEPGVKDEPQHVFQGKATLPLLDCLELPYIIVSKETDFPALSSRLAEFKKHIENNRSVAFVIGESALHNDKKRIYDSGAELPREYALKMIFERSAGNGVYVCTTGKLSREVFELREQKGMGHGRDFLTVGSMGHSLMIAYGIALAKPEKRVFCLDGDGAALMHLGSSAIVGVNNPQNLVHIVINNGPHETVGGLPTVCTNLNLSEVALALGYRHSYRATTKEKLSAVLNSINGLDGAAFVEIICNLKSRPDLGRPTTTPIQNKNELMAILAQGGI